MRSILFGRCAGIRWLPGVSKRASAKGTVPFCSAALPKLGQSPAVLKRLLIVLGFLGVLSGTPNQQVAAEDPTPLNTGRYIPPRIPAKQTVGNLPMNLITSRDGRFAITSDMGNRQALWSIRTSDGEGVSHVDFSNRVPTGATQPVGGETRDATKGSATQVSNGLYYGLAFGKDDKLYAVQGGHQSIAVLSFDAESGKIQSVDSIATKAKDFPAGLATDEHGLLYLANNAAGPGDPFNYPGSVAIYDPSTKKELGRYTFKESHGGTSNFPLGICVLADGSKAYVAAERDECVYAIDTHDSAQPRQAAKIATGAHPVAVLISHDQSKVFVANSLSDTISVIDPKTDKITATVLLRPSIVRRLGRVHADGDGACARR